METCPYNNSEIEEGKVKKLSKKAKKAIDAQRDRFAEIALHALIVSQADSNACIGDHEDWCSQYADAAYLIADTMMLMRNPSLGDKGEYC